MTDLLKMCSRESVHTWSGNELSLGMVTGLDLTTMVPQIQDVLHGVQYNTLANPVFLTDQYALVFHQCCLIWRFATLVLNSKIG